MKPNFSEHTPEKTLRILIATSLFPPDIAQPAPYIKELANRLRASFAVSILCYGAIPEAVDDVSITTILKRSATVLRLIQYTYHLWILTLKNDIVLIENGPSVELPALCVGLIHKHKLILHKTDEKIHYTGAFKILHTTLKKRVRLTISSSNEEVGVKKLTLPKPKPELYSFIETDPALISEYEESWQTHLRKLKEILV